MSKDHSISRRAFLAGSVGAGLGVMRPSSGHASTVGFQGESWVTPDDFAERGGDETQALRRFADALGNGVNGRLDRDYSLGRRLEVVGKRGFTLRGPSRLRIADNAPTNELYSGLFFRECNDFTVEDLVVDGNRTRRAVREDSGHLIKLFDSHRATFRNVRADNGICDGWYIGSTATGRGPGGGPRLDEIPSDLRFENCQADNNWRQGMSIIDAQRLVVTGGRFANTRGSWDRGRGPACGIDIEPTARPGWVRNRVRDILIDGVLFEGNQGYAIQISHKDGVSGIVVQNCTFRNSGQGALLIASEDTRIVAPIFDGWDERPYTTNRAAPPKRGLIYIPNSAGGSIVIDRPTFRNVSAAASTYLVYTRSRVLGRTRIVSPRIAPGVRAQLVNDSRRAAVID